MVWCYPQRHSGVPKNHWSRITGGTESPDPTSFPRLQFPGPILRHRGACLLVPLVLESGVPWLDSSLVAASCSWERRHVCSPGARLEPRCRLPGRRGSRPRSLCARPRSEHLGQAIRRYPQRHSGVPENHWSRITGGAESPAPTSFPRLQFPGPTLRHRGSPPPSDA